MSEPTPSRRWGPGVSIKLWDEKIARRTKKKMSFPKKDVNGNRIGKSVKMSKYELKWRRPPLTCAKAPCKSCPYRRDVPSGVWAAVEYDKLLAYDGEILEQIKAKALGVFHCYVFPEQMCAGWIGTHGAENLLALRIAVRTHKIDPAVFEYQSPVPLFPSGKAACAHGKRAIKKPGPKARKTIDRLLNQRRRKK